MRRFLLVAAAQILLLLGLAFPAQAQGMPAREQSQEDRRTALEQRVARMEALKAIERLQYAFGYYQDRFLYDEVVTLFARDNPSVQWGNRVWEGQDAVRDFWLRYWREAFAQGSSGPVAGRMLDLPQWQGIITVADDLETAQARFRTIGRFAVHREREFWISGFFANRYVSENGIWKIAKLRFCPNWSARYTEGWQDIEQDDALAWLPEPAENARATRSATAEEACPEPYPGAPDRQFHFDVKEGGDQS